MTIGLFDSHLNLYRPSDQNQPMARPGAWHCTSLYLTRDQSYFRVKGFSRVLTDTFAALSKLQLSNGEVRVVGELSRDYILRCY